MGRPVNKLAYEIPDDDYVPSMAATPCDLPLTDKQENFAREWARTGNKAAAYRLSYNVGANTAPNTVWVNSSRIADRPGVVKRFNEHLQAAALETLCTVQEALAWQLDIATANPNDIGYVALRACRHCYGIDGAYQWIDEDEFTRAAMVAFDEKRDPPNEAGGYGYTRARDPEPTCAHCLGAGISETVINDTRKLTGKALKLFKGVDFKNGQWVVTMHDQGAAWERVCRMLGAFNDKLQLGLPKGPAKALEGEMTEQQAARAYLTLIG